MDGFVEGIEVDGIEVADSIGLQHVYLHTKFNPLIFFASYDRPHIWFGKGDNTIFKLLGWLDL